MINDGTSKRRVFLIVLDSFGIGEAPDAIEYGDTGANTLNTIASSKEYNTPNLKKLGLFNIEGVYCREDELYPIASFGKMQERSRGKDTTVGHWEIAGIISKEPLPAYPNGFPDSIIKEFEKRTSRKVICNMPYSGIEVLYQYGQQHMQTGDLIVYTSADSVFQIAAHEDVIPLEDLYEYCKIARMILSGEHGVGRVIARPFCGEYPNFARTSNRHDYSLIPPKDTILDILQSRGFDTIAIGKISDIFAGKGINKSILIRNNTDGMDKAIRILEEDFNGLCFVNLVDFDMIYGHRNDIDGYARAATDFDVQLGLFLARMRAEDILIITADHGCDPGANGTDHTREFTPMLIYGTNVIPNINIGTRKTFADISATILDVFHVEVRVEGKSFYELVL